MRVLLANVPAAEEDSDDGRFIRQVVVERWQKNLDLVKEAGTEIVFRFPRRGLTGLDAFMYRYLSHLGADEVLHAIIQGERNGFDAAVITCFDDPMLWEARQAVDIPVVGIGESSMLLATMMGRRFGVVTISPLTVPDAEEKIARYGLAGRSVGVWPTPESSDEQQKALIDAGPAIEAFKSVARRLIEKGADVLIPGCGLMSPALRLAPGAEAQYPDGLTRVDGVPVVDVMAAAIKHAEMLVRMKQAGSSWISRSALFAQPTPEAAKNARLVLDYEGPGFWDC